jgi:DNA-binding NarL/FixJ family response regulator
MTSDAHASPPLATATIAIAAAHKAVRASLQALLASSVDVDLVATVGDARGAARAALEHHPDVLVMALPGMLRDGGALVRRVRTLSPQTAVILAATASGDAYRSVACAAGATALVALDGPLEDLLQAVRGAGGAPR